MDNITHSLTGALAAKIIDERWSPSLRWAPPQNAQRILFWLMVVCVNLPDIDVLLNLSSDPLFAIKHHRGLTHSVLFAPVLSFVPAIAAYLFSSLKNLKVLWVTALVGIYLHIFFDLITVFGTQLFAPLSATRYSLDWMFIIDPLFTGILALILFLGQRFAHHKKSYALGGGIFVMSYLLVEMTSHQLAYQRIKETAREQQFIAQKISALPQPLSLFRWMGVVQTEQGVHQTFFSVFDNPAPLHFTSYPQASDEFVQHALESNEAAWFMKFARHPWIQSMPQPEGHLVEIRDQQFSFNPELTRALGFAERRPPFVLRFRFSETGEITSVSFNR